jgi:phosphoserine phosphatase RsbU/P
MRGWRAEDYKAMTENVEPRGDAEVARVRAVERYQIADMPPDAGLELIAALAAQFFDAPIATVSIVHRDRIWFSAAHGLGRGVRQVAREEGLCGSVILSDPPFVVSDALTDSRTANNRFVHEHQIRFYAGAPIVTFDGYRLGAVAVMDRNTRTASVKDLAVLQNLAAIVMEQLELRLSFLDALRVEQRQVAAAEYVRDEARRHRDSAELNRDDARRGRDDARRDRDEAWRDRDEAWRDRDEARQHRGSAELNRDDARRGRDDARRDRDEAWRDRDQAQRDRDSAELNRDDAWRDRDQARVDRDDAVRDRGIAERDRDLIVEYATVLQRTLLPPLLPDIAGVALGSYFRAASSRRVGGDFYDVFPLGGTRWAFFIGDVVGHGPEAAAVTSLIRYTLRSAALHYADLTHALAELNSVLLREVEPRRFCTVLFGTLEPHASGRGFQVTVATGGHPPALLIEPANGFVDEVRPSGGMLVGAVPSATFDACSVHVRSGQTLLFYTDGLIEARHDAIPFDQDSLANFAVEHATRGVQGLIDGIATLVPKLDVRDDIAVLAFEVIATDPGRSELEMS